MKRVVILGSKPDASFVEADEVWCANAAIGFYDEAVRRYPVAVNVASATILRKNLRDASVHGGIYEKKWRAVVAASPARLVLLAAPCDTSCVVEVQEALRRAGYVPPIEICTVRRRILLVRELAKLRYPVVTRAFFRQPVAVQLRDAERLFRFVMKSRSGPGRGETDDDAPGKFRPSTGVLALLLAMRQHGTDAEYVVAGIGVEDRWAQEGDGKVLVGKTTTRDGGLTPHVHADIAILRAIAGRYAVRTTEPELAHLLPLVVAGARVSGNTVARPQAAA